MQPKLTSEELHVVEEAAIAILTDPSTPNGLRTKAKGFLGGCAKLRAALIVEEANERIAALKDEAAEPEPEAEPEAEAPPKKKKKKSRRTPAPAPEPESESDGESDGGSDGESDGNSDGDPDDGWDT